MTEFRVVWEIDIEAKTPRRAAEQAFAIQRDPKSMATVFSMTDPSGVTTEIDLLDDTDWELVTTRVPPWARVDATLDIKTVICLATDLAKYMPLHDSFDNYLWWIETCAREFTEEHMDKTNLDEIDYQRKLDTFEKRAIQHLVYTDRRRPGELP